LKNKTGVYNSGIKGTPLYMAPEIIKQLKHGRQADIWSVGCTVIEMATGSPPWSEFTDQVSALFHIGSSNDIPKIPEWLSPEGQDFLTQCFRRDPKRRPTAMKLLDHQFIKNCGPIKSQPTSDSSRAELSSSKSSDSPTNRKRSSEEEKLEKRSSAEKIKSTEVTKKILREKRTSSRDFNVERIGVPSPQRQSSFTSSMDASRFINSIQKNY